MEPLLTAYDTPAAPAPTGGAPGPAGGLLSSLPMLVAILAIFYFLLIRPQQKEQKEHQSLLAGLQKGDQVVTASGLHGKVFEVGDTVVTLEIADKVKVEVDKTAIKRRGGTPAAKAS